MIIHVSSDMTELMDSDIKHQKLDAKHQKLVLFFNKIEKHFSPQDDKKADKLTIIKSAA